MRTDYHRWFSHRLGRDMGVAVYGHWGAPILTFPTSGGDEWEMAGQSMIGALSEFIEAGRIKVFSINSNTSESFYNRGAHPYHRSWMQRKYAEYIREEVVPFVHAPSSICSPERRPPGRGASAPREHQPHDDRNTKGPSTSSSPTTTGTSATFSRNPARAICGSVTRPLP
jgi:hypothetical protein